ncbi:hypothetical protein NCAS_0J01630 [Naumovozyma castellii]|uniref:DUF4050 domain-containing protein n=1 Tax=Naumovozyma castellii TaxID=27288 RepID=G0VKV4_NAUCA|nr:hypothetical protein NCAS_0J01630 [Naumovozyma castellii CBS 4309]CCC72142.1 hypothetical protein NCAS_0J01630 [Naumovozyma castellii CBS 4309]
MGSIAVKHQETPASPKKSVKTALSHTLHKWKTVLRKITHDTLTTLDDSSSSDEKIEALFDGVEETSPLKHGGEGPIHIVTNPISKLRSIDRDSGGSLSPPVEGGPSELGIKLNNDGRSEGDITTTTKYSTTSDEGRMTDHHNASSTAQLQNIKNKVILEETYANFDSVKECAKLRSSKEEPFIDGDLIWKKRRDLWNKPTKDIDPAELKRRRDVFKSIPEPYYPRVYKKLVVDDKPLREPLNLEDALKVINSGWTETRKWANAANGLP